MLSKNKAALVEQLKSGDPYVVTGILMDIGKEGWYEFKPQVIRLINDPDPDIRTEALKVVTFDWKDPDYEKVAKEAIFKDENLLNRELAPFLLGNLLHGYRRQNNAVYLGKDGCG